MALVKASRELMQRARNWASMSQEDLRREAIRAANQRDGESLWSLVEAYLTLHGRSGARASAHTYDAYKRGIKDLLAAWQGENLLRPSRDAAVLWIRDLEAAGKSPSTVRVKVAAAKVLYKALRWAGASTQAPFADVRPASETTSPWEKRQAYTPSDMRRLIEMADGVNLVILYLGAHAGLRVSEMIDLKWEDIDVSNQTLLIREGKGGKTARVAMSHSLCQALQGLEKTSDYILPFRSRHSAKKRIERLCRRARVQCRRVHALRHTSGTTLRSQGVDIADIADHLRHATLDMARGYAKVTDSVVKRVVGEW